MGNEGAKKIAQALEQNNVLASLNLAGASSPLRAPTHRHSPDQTDNGTGAEGAEKLAQRLEQASELTALSISLRLWATLGHARSHTLLLFLFVHYRE